MSVGSYIGAQAAATVLAQSGSGGGGGGGVDLNEGLQNATDYAYLVIGSGLGLLGLVAVGWGGFQGIRKLMSDQSRDSWFKIIMLIMLGGLMVYGGISLLLDVSETGRTTVEEFSTPGGGSGGGGVGSY